MFNTISEDSENVFYFLASAPGQGAGEHRFVCERILRSFCGYITHWTGVSGPYKVLLTSFLISQNVYFIKTSASVVSLGRRLSTRTRRG